MFSEEFSLRLRRCELFLGRVYNDRFLKTIPLEVEYVNVGRHELHPGEVRSRDFLPLHEGDRWGGPWENAWIRASVDIPDGWEDGELAFALNMSGECLIVDADDQPWYAVTGCSVFNETYQKDLFFPQTENLMKFKMQGKNISIEENRDPV